MRTFGLDEGSNADLGRGGRGGRGVHCGWDDNIICAGCIFQSPQPQQRLREGGEKELRKIREGGEEEERTKVKALMVELYSPSSPRDALGDILQREE